MVGENAKRLRHNGRLTYVKNLIALLNRAMSEGDHVSAMRITQALFPLLLTPRNMVPYVFTVRSGLEICTM